jgi:hypothetical protein
MATDWLLAKETSGLLYLVEQLKMYWLIERDKVKEKKYAVGA